MQICQKHWNWIREEIERKGMSHLIAKSSEDAIRNMVTELEGREAENDFDPLMAVNNMISCKALELHGLSIMMVGEDGGHKCPICEQMRSVERSWVEGPVGEAYQVAQEKGLVK